MLTSLSHCIIRHIFQLTFSTTDNISHQNADSSGAIVQLEGIVSIGIVPIHTLVPYHCVGSHFDASHLLVPTLLVMIQHHDPQRPIQIEVA